MKFRYPAVAGIFYPNEENELKKMINSFIKDVKEDGLSGLKCLIVPHAGYVYSGPIAAYGYKLLINQKFTNVIAVGPSHYAAFIGAAEDDNDFWQTPLGNVKISRVSSITGIKNIHCYPQAHAPEHCLEVQLPFLQTILKNFTFYPLLTGEIPPTLLAETLEPALDNSTLLLISSDLSHYLPYQNAVKIDRNTIKIIESLDFRNTTMIDACGKTGIITAMHIAKSKKWKVKVLDYRNSGDTAGPKTNVVGYAAIAFYEG
ncbi:MAG: AmmeMemoRadiSam system protein B [Candidatus Bilamarchaeaceae archaeon]